MFRGSIPALITPFKNGEIDWPAFERLVEWQIDQGSHGLAPCGTTGEYPTLSHEEHNAVIKRTVEIAKNRVPVIAGTGSNSTTEAIALTQKAKENGADAVLLATPYYNKPSQEGMYQHYKMIHDTCDIPVVLYNVPGRSVVDMSDETSARLAELPNVVGIKDATNDLSRLMRLREMVSDDFCFLSGEDSNFAGFLAQGGHGIISVVANIAPAQSATIYNAWETKDLETFALMRDKLAPLARDLFCESNPVPVKYAASSLGLCSDEVRLPLVTASNGARAKVDAAMVHAGLK